jgi:hypothetical protein
LPRGCSLGWAYVTQAAWQAAIRCEGGGCSAQDRAAFQSRQLAQKKGPFLACLTLDGWLGHRAISDGALVRLGLTDLRGLRCVRNLTRQEAGLPVGVLSKRRQADLAPAFVTLERSFHQGAAARPHPSGLLLPSGRRGLHHLHAIGLVKWSSFRPSGLGVATDPRGRDGIASNVAIRKRALLAFAARTASTRCSSPIRANSVAGVHRATRTLLSAIHVAEEVRFPVARQVVLILPNRLGCGQVGRNPAP